MAIIHSNSDAASLLGLLPTPQARKVLSVSPFAASGSYDSFTFVNSEVLTLTPGLAVYPHGEPIHSTLPQTRRIRNLASHTAIHTFLCLTTPNLTVSFYA